MNDLSLRRALSPIIPGGSGVIQGLFRDGMPRLARRATAPTPAMRPTAPAPVQPGLGVRPAAPMQMVPASPGRATLSLKAAPIAAGFAPRPIVPGRLEFPQATTARAVLPRPSSPVLPSGAPRVAAQPSAMGEVFALPAGFPLRPRGTGQLLPESVRSKMESFFNTSFADVRVHVGQEAPSIGALAFTYGADLYFAPGRYNPTTIDGQRLLGHELTHVMQQRAGRVPNPLGSGIAVVQDRALEAEAERMGQRVASSQPPIQPKTANPVLPQLPGHLMTPVLPAHRPVAPPPREAGTSVQPSMPIRVSGPVPIAAGSYRIAVNSGGQEVGSVMVHSRDRSSIEVTNLGVSPLHRKHGLGTVLMASAMRAGLQLGKTSVSLASQDRGTGRLTAWYRDMGFAQVGVNDRGFAVLQAPIARACLEPSRAGCRRSPCNRRPSAASRTGIRSAVRCNPRLRSPRSFNGWTPRPPPAR